jgi:hypothetical protein
MPEDNNHNIHCHKHLKSQISLRLRPLKKVGAIFVKTEIFMPKRWQQKQNSHRRHKMTVISLLQKVQHNLTMTDTKKNNNNLIIV